MIETKSPFTALTARLTAKAAAIARARAASAAGKRRDEANHWRSARLVWPLFGQG